MLTLIAYHDGETGELNENNEFLDLLASLGKYVRLVEYMDQMVDIYYVDGTWHLYASVPVGNKVNGYVYQTKELTN